MPHYEQGEYTARIVNQGFSESKQKSTPFFFIEIEPLTAKGPNAMPERVYTRTIDWFCTEKTMQYTLEKLRALGWTGSKLQELEPGSPNHHSFEGQEIAVYCEHDDRGYDRFDLCRNQTGGSKTEATPGIASKLDRLFGKQLAASAPANGNGKKSTSRKAAAPAPPAQDAPFEDDEIPF